MNIYKKEDMKYSDSSFDSWILVNSNEQNINEKKRNEFIEACKKTQPLDLIKFKKLEKELLDEFNLRTKQYSKNKNIQDNNAINNCEDFIKDFNATNKFGLNNLDEVVRLNPYKLFNLKKYYTELSYQIV